MRSVKFCATYGSKGSIRYPEASVGNIQEQDARPAAGASECSGNLTRAETCCFNGHGNPRFIAGAIHKRIWELTDARENLEIAIFAYQKGFYVKNDYYNGINLAYLYDLRASISALADATADSVLAQRIRRRVLTICDELLPEGTGLRPEDRYWVMATMAEAWVGLGEESKAQESLLQAKALGPSVWMVETTERQLVALKKLLEARGLTRREETAQSK